MRNWSAALVVLLVAFVVPASAAGLPAPVTVQLDGDHLDWPTMIRLLHADRVSVRLADPTRQKMIESRRGALATVEAGQRVYGWNQALGPLKDRPLGPDEQREFQRRVLRSHAAGVGPALPFLLARLALVLRANAMARAAMGVRPELVDRMLGMVNNGVVPVMPEIGSLGTGDLQPMAAAGLAMMGEDVPVSYRGKQMPAKTALRTAGLPQQFPLEAGEALPVVSGGSVLTARYIDAIDRSGRALDSFTAGFALFLEATRAEQGAFDERTHVERRIPEEVDAARQIRSLVCGTRWMTDEGRRVSGEPDPRVQDATSVRAAPHILGAFRQTLHTAKETVTREANASTSNPLLFAKPGGGYEFVMGGNWAAARIGHEIDSLNAQVADLGVLSENLSGRLIAPKWSYGLPANLAGGPIGLNSGMVQVVTVASALVPEMQLAANPAGTLSRPVKGGQEDHNTMAMASMRGLAANLDRLDTVLGVQVMLGAQGIDLVRPKMASLQPGGGTSAIYSLVRQRIQQLADDRYMTPDVEAATALVRDGSLSRAVHAAAATPCAA
ncbi:aromatic amino acid ammonia-lyase [Allokutzneria sp. A3M-2-11 16]|uniref:HAL/PAL/TAL family ammonia-lyase n=1 Tax=Allokutzneria sp. A3M-2-11 16 TaxID=2962043 RepID=UPI0020B71CD0|nr:aromatic amino acid ammonia-lyase [Allokutzneria sp. A3M-2-11 16]MCP3804987.1 aromatic amino acid ammonia-lyase [Allokutzneria sp. A3M-2-11 16]